MRITNKKFNDTVKKVIGDISRRKLQEYRINGISFYNVNLKKKRNLNEYDIIVSVDEIEIPLILVRDIIEETADVLGVKIHRILVEL